jgi:Flp pilus assembly pilin Flp
MRLMKWTWNWNWRSVERAREGLQHGVWVAAARWSGQSTVEYALVGALVVIAAAGAMTLLGGEVTTVFSRITTTLSGAAPSGH